MRRRGGGPDRGAARGLQQALTLGPPEAEEQLRDLMAIGVDKGNDLITIAVNGTPRPPPL